MNDLNSNTALNNENTALKKQIAQLEKQNQDLREQLFLFSKRLNFFFHGTERGYWERNVHNKSMFLSKKLIALLGSHENILTSKDYSSLWNEIIYPEDVPTVDKYLKKLCSSEIQSYSLDYRVITRRKQLLWLHEKAYIFKKNEQGDAETILGIVSAIDDKKNLETILNESEKKFIDLLETMLDGFILFEIIESDDEDAQIDYFLIDINKAVENLTALKRINFVDNSFHTIHGGNYAFLEDLLKKTYCIKRPQKTEFYDKIVDRYFEINTYLPEQEQVIITFNDITERKIAENKLRESKNLLQDIIDNSKNILLYITDIQGKFLLVNNSYAKVYGNTKDELLDKNIEEIACPKCAKKHKELIQTLIQTKQLISNEESYTIRGREYNFLSTKFLLFDNKNIPFAVCSVDTEISELKKVEQQLYIEMQKMEMYAQTAPVMILVLNLSNEVLLINEKGCEIMEYEVHEVVGKEWFGKFVTQEDCGKHKYRPNATYLRKAERKN
ncbi:MAG: hypothetical protein CSA05_01900 [Bacteroidia bacterium]|nr:MAG: hypothetical protein CSA05_01900 [Bacteroidia bacterium]